MYNIYNYGYKIINNYNYKIIYTRREKGNYKIKPFISIILFCVNNLVMQLRFSVANW